MDFVSIITFSFVNFSFNFSPFIIFSLTVFFSFSKVAQGVLPQHISWGCNLFCVYMLKMLWRNLFKSNLKPLEPVVGFLPQHFEHILLVSGLSIPSAKSFSWMKAGMSSSSEPFTLMERQRNQRRWAAKPAHQARGWGSCTAYL